jgi:hypothetical protein
MTTSMRTCCIWWARRVLLLGGGNWNNTDNAGPSYLNANNESSNSNRNIGAHLELRLSGSEQQHIPYRFVRSNTQHSLWPVLVGSPKVRAARQGGFFGGFI